MVSTIDGRLISGLGKASVLLLALSEESRKAIFEELADQEIRELSQAMSNIGILEPEVVETILTEFLDTACKGGSVIGNTEQTGKILSNILGSRRAEELLGVEDEEKSGVWEQLSHVKQDVLVGFLRHEQPQTIAVILSRVSPVQASEVLRALPEDLAFEVIVRMLKTTSIKKEVLTELQRSLKVEFVEELDRAGNSLDPHKVLAEIFNAFDRQTEGHFMRVLEQSVPDAAERVKSLMFTFDDLVRINGIGIQKLIREMDKTVLAMALKGVNEKIKDLFFSNMSERASKLFQEDIQALGSVRLRDVEEAQKQVLEFVKQLEKEGELFIDDAVNADQMVT